MSAELIDLVQNRLFFGRDNEEKALAVASKHLCPSMLAEELAKLKRPTRVYITHLKPGAGTLTMQEVEEYAERYNPRMLSNGQVFKF